MCSIAAVAILTAAGVAAALVIVLGHWSVHNYGVKWALLILHDDSSVAASFFPVIIEHVIAYYKNLIMQTFSVPW